MMIFLQKSWGRRFEFRPTPSTKIAWYAYRAIFGIIALRAKGKAGSIGDRNWFFWL